MKNKTWSFPQECPHCHEKSITYFLKLRMIDNYWHNNPPKSRCCPCCKKALKRISKKPVSIVNNILLSAIFFVIILFELTKIDGIIRDVITYTAIIVALLFHAFIDIPSSDIYIDE